MYNPRPDRILSVVGGSRSYGLAGPSSDMDLRHVFLPGAAVNWSLPRYRPQEVYQVQTESEDSVSYELEKFLVLALQGNPNILEMLWTRRQEISSVSFFGQELLQLREAFLSEKLRASYVGYARHQAQKFETSLSEDSGMGWKNAMHALRLLSACETVMTSGQLEVYIPSEGFRQTLLDIRGGKWSTEKFLTAFNIFLDRAVYCRSVLPKEPDYDSVNKFLIRCRRYMVDK